MFQKNKKIKQKTTKSKWFQQRNKISLKSIKKKKKNLQNEYEKKQSKIATLQIQDINQESDQADKLVEISQKKETINEAQSNNNLQISKVVVTFKNLGNTCYLNTALQTIRQINYLSNCLNNEDFSNNLKDIFFASSEESREENLQTVFEIIQDFQGHMQDGGDAYICLINMIWKLSSEIAQQRDKQEFQKKFQAIFEDGFYCDRCDCYKSLDEFEYIKEEIIGLEQFTLEAAIINPVSLYNDFECEQECLECGLYPLKPKRRLKEVPDFLIFKAINYEKKPKEKKKNLKVIQQQKDQKNFSYSLIGFSELDENHYTYTAKYDLKWYNFSDEICKKVKKIKMDSKKIIYLVYQNNK